MSEIYKLYEEWPSLLQGSETPDGKPIVQTFDPLIKTLQERISSDVGVGAGKGKLGFERSPIDVKAFDLYSEIKDTVEAGLFETQLSITSDLALNVQSLEARVTELRTSGGIQEHRFFYFINKMESWVTRIWELIDPPREAELEGACPFCGSTDWFDKEGIKSTALIVRHHDGKEPEAVCRRCAEGYWRGPNALIQLGKMIDAPMDVGVITELGFGDTLAS